MDGTRTATLGPAAPAHDPRKAEFETNKLTKRLRRLVGSAIADFGLIENGDRVMVCLSGGKDSYGLLEVLLALRNRAPLSFEIVAVNLDQKQPGFPADVLPRYLARRGVPFHIAEQDTYSVVKRVVPDGKTMCFSPGLVLSPRRLLSRAARHESPRPSSAPCDVLPQPVLRRQTGTRRRQAADDGRHVAIRLLSTSTRSATAATPTRSNFR
jgi:tRNA 2-thiocytidine biosynthesis protein TtcA